MVKFHIIQSFNNMNNKKITCVDHYGKKYILDAKQFINREAIYGIYISNKKVLLVQDSKSNKWELPGGGKIELETDYKCLKREYFEETNLTINKPIKFLTEFTSYFYDIDSQSPWKTTRKFYLVSKIKGKLQKGGNGIDIQKAEYISFRVFSTLSIDKGIKKILTRYNP